MSYLLFFLVMSALGYLLIKFRDRSIFGGLLLSSGLLLSCFTLLLLGLIALDKSTPHGTLIALGLFYLLIPLIFFAICIYLILNSKTMRTKEGKSVTAKLSAGLGVNLFISFPLFFLFNKWFNSYTFIYQLYLNIYPTFRFDFHFYLYCLPVLFLDVSNVSC